MQRSSVVAVCLLALVWPVACVEVAPTSTSLEGDGTDYRDGTSNNGAKNDQPSESSAADGGQTPVELGAPPVDPDLSQPGVGIDPPSDASAPEPSTEPPADAGPTTPPATDAGGTTTSPATQRCDRWRSERQNRTEGSWTGSTASCTAGTVNAPGRDNALKLVNLYRYLAGLPAVKLDATMNDNSQACALMMEANKKISHTPTSDWKCYNETGKTTAGKSVISSSAGVAAVDLYMADPGNDTTLGHRRWILSKSLGPIGVGSTTNYSCMQVIGGTGNAAGSWVAWPPPGAFPSGAIKAAYEGLDTTGWSIQSETIDLSSASVKITDNGVDKPVTVNVLGSGYGSKYAISMVASGWTAQKGHSYKVSVSGVSPAINYQVDIMDCD